VLEALGCGSSGSRSSSGSWSKGRGEVGGGGRSLGDFLGQCHRPLAPVLRRLLQLGDPRSNPPPECGGRVFGLEVRDLSLDAALQVRDLRGRLIEAIGGGRGRLLDLGIGETPAPVLPRLFVPA
jgi:hypothetical protein